MTHFSKPMRKTYSRITLSMLFMLVALFVGCYGSAETGPIRPEKTVSQAEREAGQKANEAEMRERTHVEVLPSFRERIKFRPAEALFYMMDKIADGETDMPKQEYGDICRANRNNPSPFNVTNRSSRQRMTSAFRDILPTTSKTNVTNADVTYQRGPQNYQQLIEAQISFLNLGVNHFRESTTLEIPKEIRSEAADHIARCIRLYHEDRAETDWNGLHEDHQKLWGRCKLLKRDPLFLATETLLLIANSSASKTKYITQMARIRFAFSDYPARIPAYFEGVWTLKSTSTDDDFLSQLCQYQTTITYWINSDLRAKPEEHHLVNLYLSQACDRFAQFKDIKLLEKTEGVIASNVDLPTWIRDYNRGYIAFKKGWIYRGGGFANTVEEKQWELFRKQMRSAETLFIRAHEANRYDSNAAEQLASIAKTGESDKSLEEWFAEAIKRSPNKLTPYLTALGQLYPQWGGSADAMIDFSLQYYESDSDESDLPKLPLQCFWSIKNGAYFSDEADRIAALNSPRLLEACMKAADKLGGRDHANYAGRVRSKNFFQTAKLVFAIRANDEQNIKTLLGELKDDLNTDAIGLFSGSIDSFNTALAKYQIDVGEYREEAAKIAEIRDLTYPERIKRHNELKTICDGVLRNNISSAEENFFKSALEQSSLERQFEAGESVQLTFEPTFTNWRFKNRNQIKFVSENTITIDNRKDPYDYRAEHVADFPHAKEVSFEIDLPVTEFVTEESLKPGEDFVAALTAHRQFIDGREYIRYMGPARTSTRTTNKTNLTLFNLGRDICYGRFYDGSYYFMVDMNKDKHDIRYVLDDQYYEIYFDGEFLGRSNAPMKLSDGPVSVYPKFCLRSMRGTGQGIVSVSNIRIRKLPPGSPPLDGSPDDLVEYYKERIQLNAENAWNHLFLGNALQLVDQHELALAEYRKAIEMDISEERRVHFWIGDALDHLGRYEEAYQQYQIAGPSTGRSVNEFALSPRVWHQVTNYQEWASFRAKWYEQFRQGKGVGLNGGDTLPDQCKALWHMFNCQRNSNEKWYNSDDEFDKALEFAPAFLEDAILKQKKAFDAKQPYREEGAPAYLLFDEFFPPFRTINEMMVPK
ncbi:MAG: tetratricopeptide repeat protein [Planctomycetota bacterium]